MNRAPRLFASWNLVIHGLLLGALIAVVVYAAREVHSSTRSSALSQVRLRQELLAAQASRGIESFYRSILDDLDLPRRVSGSKAISSDVMQALLWERLRGRANCLLEIDTRNAKLLRSFSDAADLNLGQLVPVAAKMFAAITRPTIGISFVDRDELMTFLAAPAPGDQGRVLVALVPLRGIESRFLNDLNQPANMGATLLDDRMMIVCAEDRTLVAGSIERPGVDPRVREVAQQLAQRGTRVTSEFLVPIEVAGVQREPAMVTAQPIDLPDGTRWWLVVSSTLSEVDQIVGRFLRRTIIGAGIVILAMTGVLVSTLVQSIRSRVRLERLQHEVITRELRAAREIQLAWLPERQESKISLDIAAMNRPASHVSGDFYNWFELADGRCVVVIGDVTGHGLPAAFLMATTQLLVRMMVERREDPGQALRQVNRQLCSRVFSGQFVTMLVMVIDAERNTIDIANAGHPPPLIGSGGDFKAIDLKPQLVLAVENDVEYETQRFELPPGTSVLLYTDGVTDVRAPSGECLGIDGLAKCLHGPFASPDLLIQFAATAVDAFRAGREADDDLTLVAVQLAGRAEERALSPTVPQSLRS